MYAPSRQDGRDPCITSHCVGGSSSIGAKLLDKTCLGSTEERIGGSMKLLMMSSNVLKINVDNFGSTVLLFFAATDIDALISSFGCVLGDWVRVVVLEVVGGFSSILTEEMEK